MPEELVRQTYLEMKRFSVRIKRSNRRKTRSWMITAATTSNEATARTILRNLATEGYEGHVVDAATGKRWTPHTGWYDHKELQP